MAFMLLRCDYCCHGLFSTKYTNERQQVLDENPREKHYDTYPVVEEASLIPSSPTHPCRTPQTIALAWKKGGLHGRRRCL